MPFLAQLSQPLTALWSLLELPREGATTLAHPVRLKNDEMRAAADQVLDATDCADLRELVDECLMDEHSPFLAGAGAPASDRSIAEDLDALRTAVDGARLDLVSLTRTLGATSAGRCDEGFHAFKELVLAIAPLVKLTNAGKETSERANRPPVSVSDLLFGTSAPLAFRRHLLGIFRSLVSSLIIARAEEREEGVEPWLALALADMFAKGPTLALRDLKDLLTSEDVAAAIVREEKAAENLQLLIDGWKRAAKAEGRPSYFPFGEWEHEEG